MGARPTWLYQMMLPLRRYFIIIVMQSSKSDNQSSTELRRFDHFFFPFSLEELVYSLFGELVICLHVVFFFQLAVQDFL